MTALTDEMRAKALRLSDRATHYAMTGEATLAEDCRRASNGLLAAVSMLEILATGETERVAHKIDCPALDGFGCRCRD